MKEETHLLATYGLQMRDPFRESRIIEIDDLEPIDPPTPEEIKKQRIRAMKESAIMVTLFGSLFVIAVYLISLMSNPLIGIIAFLAPLLMRR